MKDELAFPFVEPAIPEGSVNTGMTLRDWFAGQALSGCLTKCGDDKYAFRDVADLAYLYADAMLARREIK